MTEPHSNTSPQQSHTPNKMNSIITSTPDVLCVFGSHENGPLEYYSTQFHLQLPKKPLISLFGGESSSSSSSFSDLITSSLAGAAGVTDEDMYHITVTCNGTYCQNILIMLNPNTQFIEFIEDSGEATSTPSSTILKNLCLIKGKNILIFENKFYKTRVECVVFLWSIYDKIVVVDIDGTLTRSDVRGYVETVYLGRYDYIHEGAVTFFSNLEKEYHVCHLYLTSRPLHHIQDTKAFLHLVHDQKGNHLPQGPLFTNKENVIRAIYRELVARTSAQFKGSVLIDILSLFVAAGANYSPFCLGVGNKETDALAYRMASINSSRILLVQTSSTIVVSVASRNHQVSGKEGEQARPVCGDGESGGSNSIDSSAPGHTELQFQTYADPSLWKYVKMKMMRNSAPTSPPLYPIPKELERRFSSRTDDNSLTTATLPSKSENAFEASRDPSDLPHPPVNFHCTLPPFQSEESLRTGPPSTSKTGRKKLTDMTDFFNPVDSADI